MSHEERGLPCADYIFYGFSPSTYSKEESFTKLQKAMLLGLIQRDREKVQALTEENDIVGTIRIIIF